VAGVTSKADKQLLQVTFWPLVDLAFATIAGRW
jgi:hypothetical protein